MMILLCLVCAVDEARFRDKSTTTTTTHTQTPTNQKKVAVCAPVTHTLCGCLLFVCVCVCVCVCVWLVVFVAEPYAPYTTSVFLNTAAQTMATRPWWFDEAPSNPDSTVNRIRSNNQDYFVQAAYTQQLQGEGQL